MAPDDPVDNFTGIGDVAPKDSQVEESPVDSPDDSPVDSPVHSDPPPEPLPLCINEFMPDNQSALIAEDGSTPDWIEVHNPTDEHHVLTGWAIADDAEEGSPWLLGDVLVPAGGFALIYADGVPEAGPDHTDFKLSSAGGDIALWAPDGRGQVIHYGNVEPDFSVARIPDCCVGEGCFDFVFRGTPDATNNVLVEVPVFEAGSTWAWWDQGEAPVGWTEADHDTSAWSTGAAPLGFGEPVRTTEVAGGPADDRTPTIYFRKEVEVTESEGAVLELLVDDGAVVWINGVEVLRQNLPEGDVTHLTWASEAVADAAESAYTRHELDDVLADGTNVIAVEVHQAAATSSDLGFDLALSALVWKGPE